MGENDLVTDEISDFIMTIINGFAVKLLLRNQILGYMSMTNITLFQFISILIRNTDDKIFWWGCVSFYYANTKQRICLFTKPKDDINFMQKTLSTYLWN